MHDATFTRHIKAILPYKILELHMIQMTILAKYICKA